MKCYVVTGAAGFIGYHTVKMLLESGHKVIGIDNLNDYYDPTLKQRRLQSLTQSEYFQFYRSDIEEKDTIHHIFSGHKIDAVINLAARAGVAYSIHNPGVYISTNIRGTVNLLELMHDFGIKKMVLASTSSVYAGQTMPFREDLAVNTPISPYAASKKGAEMMAYTYHYLYGLDITVLRYFTVYGPAGRPDMSPFRFIKWIDEGTPLEIFGDGSQARDFTYVEDIARGTISALREVGYEIINLGGGNNPISLNSMISYIEQIIGKKARREESDFLKTDVRETWADITKAASLLDWKPLTDFQTGLKKTIEWYLANKPWIKNIKV